MSTIQRDMEQTRYERNLIESLLVCSIDKDSMMPTIKEFILSELVNGTISYVGGDAGEIKYKDIRMLDHWQQSMKMLVNYFREGIGKKDKLDEKIKSTLLTLIKPQQERSPPDRPYLKNKLYDHLIGAFGEGIFSGIIKSIWSLPSDLIKNIQEKVLPNYSESERKDIIGIGKAMRPFIEEDLVYIGKHFNW